MAVKKLLSEKKGVAGLNVYLSLIAMLFMIGIIVMVFQIAGSKLADSTRESTSATKVNETASLNATGHTLADASTKLNFASPSVVWIINATSNATITSGNYTLTNNVLYNKTSVVWQSVKVTYSYTYDAETDASTTINDTKNSLSDTTGFFPTFIVLGAMVVLVLLVVIIINSIRATGITSEGA